jgi:hypothetical protein
MAAALPLHKYLFVVAVAQVVGSQPLVLLAAVVW